jgi:potassium channel subfamily K, other eukaryote
MNDPGLDDSIANTANLVEETAGENAEKEEEERSFLMPARWWYASTAFPLAAGTFGPTANAFSICALAENWRVSIPKGRSEDHGIDIPDPRW